MQLCDPAVLPSTPLMNLLRFMLATLVPRVAPSSLLIQFHAHCTRGRIGQKLTSFVPGFPLEFVTGMRLAIDPYGSVRSRQIVSWRRARLRTQGGTCASYGALREAMWACAATSECGGVSPRGGLCLDLMCAVEVGGGGGRRGLCADGANWRPL